MEVEILKKISEGIDTSLNESEFMMSAIADGKLSPVRISAYLALMAAKGETPDEIAGGVLAFRKHALKVPHHQKTVFDCCGTGGDCSGSFNISTASAFVIAACGVPTAKHGNRSVSSQCGSADVLEELGVKIDLGPESVATCLDELRICFMFAPVFHPAMKNAAPVRKELGIRTIFNLLGPLLNPAKTTHQIIGAAQFDIAEKLAMTAFRLNDAKICLLHNTAGLDELAPFGENWIIAANSDGITKTKLDLPVDNGINMAHIRGGGADENARIILRILGGEISPRYKTVALNAGMGLYHAGFASNIIEGMVMAEETIDSGKALNKLEKLIELSNRLE